MVFARFVVLSAACVLSASPVLGVEVRGIRWDGTTFAGQWGGIKDAEALDVQAGAEQFSVSVDEIATLEFSTALRAPFGLMGFFLHDGGVLHGEMTGGRAETIVARTAVGDVSLGWSELAAIRLAEPTQFKRAMELFEEALRSRLPSQDMLVSRDQADVKVLQGRIETLDARGGAFVFADEPRRFQNEKLFGIVFAAGASKPPTAQVLVELTDGSSLTGRVESANPSTLQMQSSFDATVRIPLESVRRMKFHSDRVQYLSDLKPSAQQSDGFLHAPWAVRFDTNVMGSPISLGGKEYERGLGVHSRTELTYSLGKEFERFAATIGIDDGVRPLGGVVMRVLGDGRTLFDSGVLTGSDPPRSILVDVSGVQALTLLVDYGPGLDTSDQVDWADARLLRPKDAKSKRGLGS